MLRTPVLLVVSVALAAGQSVWDGVYTEAQASRGAMAFGQSCSGCHTLAGEGKSPLAGDPFWKSFSQKSVGDLVDYVSANMPNGSPGSLSAATYRDIVAAMLKANGFPAGAGELGHSEARIVPKDGSTALPADALVRVVGCLARRGDEWVVTRATAPERAEHPGGSDDSRPLGTRTLALKFVLTRLDSWVDSRVAVSGLLIGNDGSDGINVTSVSRVAARCP